MEKNCRNCKYVWSCAIYKGIVKFKKLIKLNSLAFNDYRAILDAVEKEVADRCRLYSPKEDLKDAVKIVSEI